jgi:hypothetical protein
VRLRYRPLAGVLLLLASVLAGVGAAEALDGRMPLRRAALGCLGAALVLLVGDLLIRRLSDQRRFWARYLGSQAAWSVRGVLPLWLLGVTLLVAALSFPSP